MTNARLSADHEAQIRESFTQQSFMKTLGASISKLEKGVCEVTLPFSPTLTQQHGYMHAGAITSIADSAAGYAALALSPPNSSVLSAEFKVNLLSPAKGESFIARAKVLKSGRTLTVVYCEVFAVEKTVESLCFVLMGTMMIKTQ